VAILLDSIEADVMPDHTLITLLGADFDGAGRPDPGENGLCWAGTEQICLFSEIASGHRARVTVEAWDQPAPFATAEQALGDNATIELLSTSGRILISALDERPLTGYLQVGPPGRYTVHVLVTGRRRVRALARTPAWSDDTPVGVEHFRLRIWAGA